MSELLNKVDGWMENESNTRYSSWTEKNIFQFGGKRAIDLFRYNLWHSGGERPDVYKIILAKARKKMPNGDVLSSEICCLYQEPSGRFVEPMTGFFVDVKLVKWMYIDDIQ